MEDLKRILKTMENRVAEKVKKYLDDLSERIKKKEDETDITNDNNGLVVHKKDGAGDILMLNSSGQGFDLYADDNASIYKVFRNQNDHRQLICYDRSMSYGKWNGKEWVLQYDLQFTGEVSRSAIGYYRDSANRIHDVGYLISSSSDKEERLVFSADKGVWIEEYTLANGKYDQVKNSFTSIEQHDEWCEVGKNQLGATLFQMFYRNVNGIRQLNIVCQRPSATNLTLEYVLIGQLPELYRPAMVSYSEATVIPYNTNNRVNIEVQPENGEVRLYARGTIKDFYCTVIY